MSKFYAFSALTLLMSFQAAAICTNESLSGIVPKKLLVYHTDKQHKIVDATHPVHYELDHDQFSQSEHLYHLSHKKEKDKKCSLFVTKGTAQFALKQKDILNIKSADMAGQTFTMTLDHQSLSAIVCTGVKTMGDLKDVMEPYLTFSCKDKFAYKTTIVGGSRLPASVK